MTITKMILASSSAQPSSRPTSVAKPLCFPHGLARAVSNPAASRPSVRARMAVPLRAEDVSRRIDFVRPLDTTLLDGEQSPEDIMSSNDKLLAVVTIKAGFSVNSPEDLEAVQSMVIEVANTPAVDGVHGEDGHVPGSRNPHIDISLATSKILKLPVKPEHEQVVDMAKEAASLDEATIYGTGERARNVFFDVVVIEIRCCTGVNIRECSTMTSKMVQEQSAFHAQTHKSTFGANAITKESGIHQDLNVMRTFKGTTEAGSTHEIVFDNGKLSGSRTFGTKLVEPPASLDSHLHTIFNFIDLVVGVICRCWFITGIVQQLPFSFIWQMAQPCLRVIAFSGLGITLALGFAAMCHGMMVVLKAKSTSHSA